MKNKKIEDDMEVEELASLTIDWLYRYHFKKHEKVHSHEIMSMLMEFERSPIKRIYATRIVECSEFLMEFILKTKRLY